MRRSTRSPRGNASGSPSARIAMYCAVQSPIPGIAVSAVTVSAASADAPNRIAPLETARASARMAWALRAHDADRFDLGRHQLLGSRERSIAHSTPCAHRRPEPLRQPSGHRRRCANRDLLSEDGSHRQLETIPGARRPDAGMPRERFGAAIDRCRDTRRSGSDRRQGRTSAEPARRSTAARERRRTGHPESAPDPDGAGDTSMVPCLPSTVIVRE